MRSPCTYVGVIRSWFHVTAEASWALPVVDEAMLPRPGEIVAVVGPSGAGKSSLLRALRGRYISEHKWIDIHRARLPVKPVIDCFPGLSLKDSLDLLARVGLSEAAVFVRKPAEISEGQRYRLRLAISLMRALRLRRSRRRGGRNRGVILVCDEFASSLDDVTAAVVCAAVRRVATSGQFGVIVATGRDALLYPLRPDVIIRCDFGRVDTERQEAPAQAERVIAGSTQTWSNVDEAVSARNTSVATRQEIRPETAAQISATADCPRQATLLTSQSR